MKTRHTRAVRRQPRQLFPECLEPRRLLSGGDIGDVFAFGSKLFFSYDDGVNGAELWSSDGTATGTKRVKDINPGADGSYPGQFAVLNGVLYFAAHDWTHGRELWRTDGTGAGTKLVYDYEGGWDDSMEPSSITAFGGSLYFFGSAGDPYAISLWKSNGTTAGTKPYVTLDTTAGGAGGLVATGNALYFSYATAQGYELWTVPGLRMVKDIRTYTPPDPPYEIVPMDYTELGPSSYPMDFTPVGNYLYFTAEDDTHFREVWRTDGTEAGTFMVKDVHPAGTSTPAYLTAVGSTVYFSADDGVHGTELWKTNGTSTSLVKDIVPGGIGSAPLGLTAMGGKLYFSAIGSTGGRELWRSDGTSGGTYRLKDINPGAADGLPETSRLGVNGSTLHFAGSEGAKGFELWRSNGTSGGTYRVKDINPGNADSMPTRFTAVGNLTYFVANDATHPGSLWRTDGTAAGTKMVLWVDPQSASIAGTVFNDLDRDGKRDTGEPLITAGSVYADLNNNKVLDFNEPMSVIDELGQYTIQFLKAGNYNVRFDLPAGWYQTTPTNSYGVKVTLAAAQAHTGVVHGVYFNPASVNGRVFNDLNHDGIWGAGEAGIGGRQVYLDYDNDNLLDPYEPFAWTDKWGKYRIQPLTAGIYSVRQVLASGWKQSRPTGAGAVTITLAQGQALYGVLHGTYYAPVLGV